MFNGLGEMFGGAKSEKAEVSYEDFVKANPKVMAEVIRQGEARLSAQLQTALASDTRSVGLASIQAATSAALIIAAAQQEISGASEIACYVSAVILLAGAIIAGWALRSVGFGFVGNRPKFWVTCISDGDDIKACLAGTAVHMDRHLAFNDRIMRRHGVFTNVSLSCLAAAPLSALVVVGLDHLPL